MTIAEHFSYARRKWLFYLIFLCLPLPGVWGQSHVIWQIGSQDGKGTEFALAPSRFSQFLNQDFGWEDRYYLIGRSSPATDWPYALPGPADGWGGTGPTSGVRYQQLSILFGIDQKPATGNWKLILNLLDNAATNPPLFKVSINGHATTYQLPAGGGDSSLTGNLFRAKKYTLEVPFRTEWLQSGNEITLTILQGSWLLFDQIRLEGPQNVKITQPSQVFVRTIQPAAYQIEKDGKPYQPLLIDLEHLSGKPRLSVWLDKVKIQEETIETGRYQLEAPMPAVTQNKQSEYEIKLDGKTLLKGKVARSAQPLITPADYVDTQMGSAHSRWMIAPGPWMPFSMVKLSPDNQPAGWQAGYDPSIESIGSFSHIHEWTMAAIGIMPVNGPLKIQVGDPQHPGQGYRSRMDKASEQAPLGYYKVHLTDYDIQAELTATTRCGFQRYTFPNRKDSRVMVDFQIPAEYTYHIEELEVKQKNDHTIEGFSKQKTPDAWSGGVDQEYTIYFVIEFDQPIRQLGTWINDSIQNTNQIHRIKPAHAGAYAEFDTEQNKVVQVRSALSLVSLENARLNLETEVVKPFGWDFNAVRQAQVKTWNELLSRLQISTSDRREKVRFYTNMYRALCSRNTWSDVNGQWVDATEKVHQFANPKDVALGCDAFWNTFWNLNQFWNLVTPEWSSRWVKSQLAMYDANGWLAKGPAGMEYIPVMVAEHEIPLVVSAYQMGIRDYDVNKALAATIKTQTTLPEKVGNGLAGNADLQPYLTHKFVPYDKGRFSNSLEYAFDDYCVAQFAKSLGQQASYKQFSDRANWWQNAINPKTGYAHLRGSDGNWQANFDPFKSGANEHYVEGNAWQLTFFVPQNVPALAKIIGQNEFIKRLNWGFTESEKLRFNAPGDQYWDYPVIQGNQQSMHFAFLFNWVKQPWLTQQWSRSIVDRYYGSGVSNAYLGDEDQGQMSAWFIMAALGLFQTDGGCRIDPIYEIGSPLYSKVVIDLGSQYGRGKSFTIEAHNASRTNKFVQKAVLNGKELNACWFSASALLKGGSLVLEMGPQPNKNWGIIPPPVAE
ncbi:GH92 family glycosyl hydrolase [Xanthocytophaga agilis]|uniref:GH92 family glycosyl hydrolase n=1 Tax=Xanthocytophaga agilis TaxID=3048010 RepID=A0AAE3UIN4_9BACT|nr:GH92 family glycosyl hydrolase [Xanthocytophaga agilis]MDJ1505606.1 GH92 family glycosyl hydrolase [Xanthocytophaga agilis]